MKVFGVMNATVGRDAFTLRPSGDETDLTVRNKTKFSDSIPSKGKDAVATEDDSNNERRTSPVETRWKLVNAFANGMYMDTEIDDKLLVI